MPEEFKPADTKAQEMAERAAIRAITDTFRLLGVDISDMDNVNDLRDDFRFVRRQREGSETRRTEASRSTVTAVIGAAVGMLVSALTWIITNGRHSQ